MTSLARLSSARRQRPTDAGGETSATVCATSSSSTLSPPAKSSRRAAVASGSQPSKPQAQVALSEGGAGHPPARACSPRPSTRRRNRSPLVAEQAVARVGALRDRDELERELVGVVDAGESGLAGERAGPGADRVADRVADRARAVVELGLGRGPEAAAREDLALEVGDVAVAERPSRGSPSSASAGLDHRRRRSAARPPRPSRAAAPPSSRSGGRRRSSTSRGRSRGGRS